MAISKAHPEFTAFVNGVLAEERSRRHLGDDLHPLARAVHRRARPGTPTGHLPDRDHDRRRHPCATRPARSPTSAPRWTGRGPNLVELDADVTRKTLESLDHPGGSNGRDLVRRLPPDRLSVAGPAGPATPCSDGDRKRPGNRRPRCPDERTRAHSRTAQRDTGGPPDDPTTRGARRSPDRRQPPRRRCTDRRGHRPDVRRRTSAVAGPWWSRPAVWTGDPARTRVRCRPPSPTWRPRRRRAALTGPERRRRWPAGMLDELERSAGRDPCRSAAESCRPLRSSVDQAGARDRRRSMRQASVEAELDSAVAGRPRRLPPVTHPGAGRPRTPRDQGGRCPAAATAAVDEIESRPGRVGGASCERLVGRRRAPGRGAASAPRSAPRRRSPDWPAGSTNSARSSGRCGHPGRAPGPARPPFGPRPRPSGRDEDLDAGPVSSEPSDILYSRPATSREASDWSAPTSRRSRLDPGPEAEADGSLPASGVLRPDRGRLLQPLRALAPDHRPRIGPAPRPRRRLATAVAPTPELRPTGLPGVVR